MIFRLQVEGNTFTNDLFHFVSLLCCAFFAIVFIQSALDKILDYKGNKSYFETQFGKSILKNFVSILLPVLLLLELASGLLCASGIVWWLMDKSPLLNVIYGLLLSAMTLLCLLLGQRIAKDYAGASSLTGYFIVSILGLIATAFID